MNTRTEYRVALMNGRFGYGASTWEALVNAVGETKAALISDQYANYSPCGRWYARNGVLMATVEIRHA